MGGSLGFLLGLSVLGLIGILEKIFVMLITRFCGHKKRSEDSKADDIDMQSQIEKSDDSKSDTMSDTTLEFQIVEKSQMGDQK